MAQQKTKAKVEEVYGVWGEEELGQTAQCQWAQQHTAPRAHQESGPAPSFRGLTLENRESVVRSVPKSQQLTEVLT